MRKNERLYVIISFIIGLCLLLFSSLMFFCNIHRIWAAEKQETVASVEEKNDQANSWRYEDGNLKQNLEEKIQNKARTITNSSIIQVTIPQNATAQGIDVSYHNGDIDWQKVKSTGKVDYAIIRCGYGRDFTYADDPKWDYNSRECERLGIPYGAYLYGKATSAEAAKSEAQHVIRLLEGKHLTYPIYYDMEDNTQANLGADELGQIAKTFFDTLKEAGYTNVGVYANTTWFNNKLTSSVFSQYPKWVAQYNSSCSYKGSYHMWQYTSAGCIDGISGNVDLNFKLGSWGPAPLTTGIRLNKTTLNLTNGTSYKLSATVYSSTNPKQNVQWKTSNSSIAVVNSQGVVTAKSAGRVTITAMTSNGKRAYCTVTIKPKTNRITKLKRTGKKSIKIYWTKVSGTTGYQVYMSTKKNSGYKRIKTVSGKYSSYTKGKLKKGKRYYFKVRSYKKVGGKYYISSYSTVKTIKR